MIPAAAAPALPAPTTLNPAARGTGLSLGGIMPVKSLRELQASDRAQAQRAAQAASNQPVVQGLAAHVRRHWSIARDARRPVEKRMLAALRSLRGEYDPDTLARIRQQSGSEIYMMLFATKARQAKALLADVLLGTEDDKPWTINPTPSPDLPPDAVQQIMQGAMQIVAQAEASGAPMEMEQVRQMLRDARTQALQAIEREARQSCQNAERLIDDALTEGGFIAGLDAFLDDLLLFPTAYMKGPVVRRTAELQWTPAPGGGYEPLVEHVLKPHWERVDPLNIYHAPWSRHVNDGFLIEYHSLEPAALEALIGVEGYSEEAIREVLVSHRGGTLKDWMSFETERAQAEGRSTVHTGSEDNIDALQYWGRVTGQLLLDWGMPAEQVPDAARVYDVEMWLVDHWVIKATINPDPLARRPYFATSFKRVPGTVIGMSMHDTMVDCEAMCNAAARALSNNMGIASGPQVWVNVDRLPDGQEVTAMFPWKITQTTNDPTGSTAAPMGFFQPSSNAAELMGVFEKFSQLADEYTGVPRYMTGDGNAGGAGRTASGMSMMVGNAGKTVKSLVSGIDMYVIGPLVERAYEFLLRYGDERDLKGDLRVVARGALSLMTKEAARVRRNEFLSLVLGSPAAQQLVGPQGLAALMRANANGLDLDTRTIVPTDSELQIAAIRQAMSQQAPSQPAPDGGGQQLMDGTPVSDHFGR